MKQFEKIVDYPEELKGRFNSFITTEFDDSMTIEMQLRVLIKWIMKNIDLTNAMVDYLNDFIEKFDGKLYETVEKILEKWYEDGVFDEILKDALDDFNKRIKQLETTVGIQVSEYLKFDGSDETTELQALFNQFENERFIFPNNKTINISKTVYINAFTIIDGNGCKIQSLNQAGITMLDVTKYSVINDLILIGNGGFNYEEAGFNILGSLDCNEPTYVDEVYFNRCETKNIGGFAIKMKYGNYVYVNDCKLFNTGYAGVHCFSSNNIYVDRCVIDGIIGGGSNMLGYNVTFNNLISEGEELNPVSTNCKVSNSIIRNNRIWEGLDTHSGEKISFINNTIENCRVGIAIVSGQIASVQVLPPKDCSVIGNTIIGMKTGGSTGISIAGANKVENATNILVNGNNLIKCGKVNDNTNGAIRSRDTTGLIITDNLIKQPFEYGICLLSNNIHCSVSNNTIINPISETNAGSGGISLRNNAPEGNDVLISNNVFSLTDKTLATYVGERAIGINGESHKATIGFNLSNFNLKHFTNKNTIVLENNLIGDSMTTQSESYFTTTEGHIIMYKNVTIPSDTTDLITVPFPYTGTLAGLKSASVSLNQQSTAEDVSNFNKLGVSTSSSGWTVRLSEVGNGKELNIVLQCICAYAK